MLRAVEGLKAENLENDGLAPFLEDCFTMGEDYTCSLAEIEQVLEIYRERHRGLPAFTRARLSARLCLRQGITRVAQFGHRKGPLRLRGLAPKLAWTASAASTSGRDAQYKDAD
jgi:hypothetical protein